MRFSVLLSATWACKDEHPWRWLSAYSTFHLDNGVAMNDFRFAASLIATVDQFSDCLIGRVVMELLALPAIDYSHGREMSRFFFEHAKVLREKVEIPFESDLSWNIETIDRHIGLLGVVFFDRAPSEEPASCFGLKFYFYADIPDFDRKTPIDANDERYLTFFRDAERLPMSCMFGMYGTEIVVPSLLRRKYAKCVTTDKEKADFFVVPSFFKCLDQLNWVDKFAEEGTVAVKLLDEILDFLKEKETWKRRRGADHLFLFSWGLYPCKLHAFNDGRMLDAVHLQVENICTREKEIPKLASYTAWKDVIIPGLVDMWRIRELKRLKLSASHKDILLSFHGRTYGPGTTRDWFVSQLENFPGTSIGGFIDHYHQTVVRSRFCLAARGVTSWTIHLFVALFAGCVPVVISDDLVFPFDKSIVDFDTFIVRWPEDLPPLDLYAHLTNITDDDYRRRQALAEKAACWFDYFSDDPNCSAMIALFRGLKKKRVIRDILDL